MVKAQHGRIALCRLLFGLLINAAAPAAVSAIGEMTCTVTSVHDGDTLTAQCGDRRIKVRLSEIDAPERNQPYGAQSTASLRRLCIGQSTVINSIGNDRYGRTLARVTCGAIDANATQVKRGYAWAFTRYLVDPEIAEFEAAARADRRGLWRGKNPEPPWDYRKRKN